MNWCNAPKEVTSDFFKKQVYKIFKNKEKFYFIDKEL